MSGGGKTNNGRGVYEINSPGRLQKDDLFIMKVEGGIFKLLYSQYGKKDYLYVRSSNKMEGKVITDQLYMQCIMSARVTGVRDLCDQVKHRMWVPLQYARCLF